MENMNNDHKDYDTAELLVLVAKLTEAYTSKESTSVTYEKASQLMRAVLYCLEEQGSTNVPEHRENLQQVYQTGYQMVLEKVKKAKDIYESILPEFKWYGNEIYCDTIIKGMPAFFIHYDPKFCPQEHLLTLDYPLITAINERDGIDTIYYYLQCIACEQRFLQFFPAEIVEDLLSRYHYDYSDLVINVASIVLRNVLGSMILKKDIFDFHYTEEDHTRLLYFIEMTTVVEAEIKLTSLLQVFLKDIVKITSDHREAIYQYLSKDIPDFLALYRTAAKTRHLDALFPI